MKKIQSRSSVLGVAHYELGQMLISYKFLILFLLSFMFMHFYSIGIKDLAADYHLFIFPAQTVFYFADITYSNIALLLVILLFSDLPIRDGGQILVRLRSGKRVYEWGQMIAIAVASFVYVLCELLMEVILCLPNIGFSSWGKVWGAVASYKLAELGYRNTISVDQQILSNYTPWQAIGYTAVIFYLTCVMYGLFVYLVNKVTGTKVGTYILAVWSMAWIFMDSFSNDVVMKLRRFSPQKWNDLGGRLPSENLQTIAIIGVICVVLAGGIILATNKDNTRW